LLGGAYRKTGDVERLLAEDLRQAEALGLSGEALAAATQATAAIKRSFNSGGSAEAARSIPGHMPENERGRLRLLAGGTLFNLLL
jgi:hypothetical protein